MTRNSMPDVIHSPAVEDYLRAIYQLSDQSEPAGARVTTSRLAERLDVRPASVTAMLQKLAAAAPALVDYHKSHGARLTAEGERAALGVVRNHRLLELFLHEKLGFRWDEVHDEADRLEHAISETTADRIAEALGHPARDPHGHAIPDGDLSLLRPAAVPLADLAAGETAIIHHVADEDAELLRYLDTIGLHPGQRVEVVHHTPEEDLLWLRVGDNDPLPLGPDVTAHVFVERRPAADETGNYRNE